MTARDRRWPVVTPAALALLVAAELAAYLLFAPVTTTPAGESAGALAAGNAFLVGLAVAVVAAAAIGTAAAARGSRRVVWLAAAALALLGVAGIAVGPQVLAVALLLVVAALLAEAAVDGTAPRRNGTEPLPVDERPPGPGGEAVTVEPPPAESDRPPAGDRRPPEDRLGGPSGEGEPVAGERAVEDVEASVEGSAAGDADGPEREVVVAGLLLVPLAALLGVSVLTTPVARPLVAATAVVVFAGAGAAVAAAARS